MVRGPDPWMSALAGLACVLLLVSCAGPAGHYRELARQQGAQALVLPGTGYQHVAFYAPGDGTRRLHVYLDGDGTPWAAPRRVASDPGPRDPLVLELMLQDPAPALYLGRPCYLGAGPLPGSDAHCDPRLWTSHRYGERVLASMTAALEGFMNTHGRRPLSLIGFSGGGTLAVLLARRLPAVEAVLTLAGNLDPEAWTRHHGYLPLTGSLNPRRLDPLPGHVYRLHLVGSEDTNVLPSLAGLDVETLDGVDHNCCWRDLWPAILNRLNRLEHR